MSEQSKRTLVPVLLSGGSGTRLWPLSREHRPKQFLPLVGERSLFQESLRRLQPLRAAVQPAIVVCNSAHRFLVAEQVRAAGATAQSIVLEPAGRNTAPAVAVAALLALAAAKAHGSPDVDPLLLVLPADHVIGNVAAFVAAVDAAIAAADQDRLVTFGVVPSAPETGYGYLLRGADRGAWAELDRFVEKPDAATAQTYVDSGRYLWNSGMFLFSARAYLAELERFEPAIAAACERAVAAAEVDADFTRLGAAFLDCPANSIDYAVMERTGRAAVVPLDADWSDVGSWSALHDVLEKDDGGNSLMGDVIAHGCTNTYVSASGRLVAVVGLEGVVVVETDDAVLIVAREHAQDVKRIVEALKLRGRADLLGVVEPDRR